VRGGIALLESQCRPETVRARTDLVTIANSFSYLRLRHGHVLPPHVHVDGAMIGAVCRIEHGNRATHVWPLAQDPIRGCVTSGLVVA
jgi:hypothetical protein